MIRTLAEASPFITSMLSALLIVVIGAGQASAQGYRLSPNDTLTSVQIVPGGGVTFRVFAPAASVVKIGGSDLPEQFRNVMMTKSSDGVWETVAGPLAPGSYRYTFMIDNVSTVDPKNPLTSESNGNVWSLMHVPGADFMDTKDVPHGAVSEVTYYSKPLGRFRRMHVYTPPGYESGTGTFPVLYLLHGAFDCDDSWTTVGRAGVILDNLIAEKKAVPMIVVMPAGHTGPFMFGRQRAGSQRPDIDEFTEDFTKEVRPYTERTYRVSPESRNRAIAGLSMGGAQSLNIVAESPADFTALGVFSSGVFELGQAPTAAAPTVRTWEEKNAAMLGAPDVKNKLGLIWFATGKEDFLLKVSQNTVALLKKHGFPVVYKETSGAHTWDNWREYLNEFAPQLFH